MHVRQESIIPSLEMYKSLLKACTNRKDLARARQVNADLTQRRPEYIRYLGETLVKTFVKCDSLEDALKVFEKLAHRTATCWTEMISGFVKAGQGRTALRMYRRMQEEGVQPSKYTFLSVVQACGSDGDLEEGKRIHAEVCKYRCDSDLFVHTCILDMYVRCGSILHAQNVFDSLPQHDVVAWTVMISGYAKQGEAEKALQVYEQMREEGVSPNDRAFVSAIRACGMLAEGEQRITVDGSSFQVKSLAKGKELHADVRRRAYDSDVFVGNTVLGMYGKCGSIVDVQIAFEGLHQRNVVSWNAMLAAHAQHSGFQKTLQVYEAMLEDGISPDDWTLMVVIQACQMPEVMGTDSEDRHLKTKVSVTGKTIHTYTLRKGYNSDVLVGTALASMYVRCGSIVDAHTVFRGLSSRNVVSWTTMVAAYAEQGQAEKALQMYEEMKEENVSPDAVTYVSVLQACGLLAELENDVFVDGQSIKVKSLGKVKVIHAGLQRKGHHTDMVVANSLISMYGKCGSTRDAENIFEGLTDCDVVSWNAMLTVCTQQCQYERALQLYRRMEEKGTSADEVTLVNILQACSSKGSLDLCRQIHNPLISSRKKLGPYLANTLIHVYGKCGSMEDARKVFDALTKPDVISWTAMIAGYAREGNCAASLSCYEEMQLTGMKPNGVTFLALLSACCHAGLVDKGVEYFESMSRDYGVTPTVEHYSIVVDLLGRAGHFAEIVDLFGVMPMEPDLAIWSVLLHACQKHGNVGLGKVAFDRAMDLQQDDAAAYVLMWNIYADAGLWKRAEEVRELRRKAGAWKAPGQTWLELEQDVHTFVVRNCGLLLRERIEHLSRELTSTP